MGVQHGRVAVAGVLHGVVVADLQSNFAIAIVGLHSAATMLLDTTDDPSWCYLQQQQSEC